MNWTSMDELWMSLDEIDELNKLWINRGSLDEQHELDELKT